MAEQNRRSPEERVRALEEAASRRRNSAEQANYRLVKARKALRQQERARVDAFHAGIGAALVAFAKKDPVASDLLAQFTGLTEGRDGPLVAQPTDNVLEQDQPSATPDALVAAAPKTPKKSRPVHQESFTQPELIDTRVES